MPKKCNHIEINNIVKITLHMVFELRILDIAKCHPSDAFQMMILLNFNKSLENYIKKLNGNVNYTKSIMKNYVKLWQIHN